MKAKAILLLFCTVFILSCKNDKADGGKDAPAEPVDDLFKVTISVVSKEPDTFSLFYTEDGTTNFNEKPIMVDFGGMPTTQLIVYRLPESVFPSQLRLDFGMNKNQKEILFQSILMEYKGKSKLISGPELGNFFRADDSKCTFDPSTGAIIAKVVDGTRQFPSLYPQEANLKPEIEKLIK